MDDMLESLEWLLGAETGHLDALQMIVRAIIVYLSTLLMVRLGEKRMLGKSTAFDVILGIIIGSVVSRAVNGSAPMVPTLAAVLALVALHWLVAVVAYHGEWFATVVKGSARQLIREGEIDWKAMRRSQIGSHDLRGALRERGFRSPDEVSEAYLERSGEISAIGPRDQPRVIDVQVASGVQVVRIRLD